MLDDDWTLLLSRIRDGRCTPFLGAGACYGSLPTGAELAKRWAAKHGYPLEDTHDLARVAQFIGVQRDDAMYPKEMIQAELRALPAPDYAREDEPHGVLARLPIPIYMTTNYDDYMVAALRHHHKHVGRELCRWNASPAMQDEPTVLDSAFVPTPENPLVYHLHGHLDLPESLVLTEDDYLDFLVAVSRDKQMLPHQIQKALAGTSLLFIGYRLADWDFRVLHRGLVMASEPSLRRLSVTVQLPAAQSAQRYLDRYFDGMKARVYWGTAADFAAELTERWERFAGEG